MMVLIISSILTVNMTKIIVLKNLVILSKDTINDLCYLLHIKKDINRRTLMENIIPKIIEILDIDKSSSYKDIFYSIYERKLEENNINRIELYDFNKVVQVCNKQMNGDKLFVTHSTSKLAKIITNLIIYDFNKQNKANYLIKFL